MKKCIFLLNTSLYIFLLMLKDKTKSFTSNTETIKIIFTGFILKRSIIVIIARLD